jgi:hydroxymethylglutaryl-CoA reductase
MTPHSQRATSPTSATSGTTKAPAGEPARATLSSRIEGFYRLPIEERRRRVLELGLLGEASREHLARGGCITLEAADKMTENVVGLHALPLSLALNFVVNGRDVLVPMATEEPSVVAAASNAAKMARASGGFFGEAMPAVMTAQVQLDDVPEPDAAAARVLAAEARLRALADASIPRMVERGGGCRELDVRVLSREHGVVVAHLYVDVGDAMGANLCDTVAEAVAPAIHELTGGTMGLRILSNLADRRLVRARARVTDEAVGGAEVAEGIARASRFADLDPYRAVTHNKGFMNGLDAVALALGQDFRALEAGAHAFAAQSGAYRPLSRWRRVEGGLEGDAELPLAVGIVGGCFGAHAGVSLAAELLDVGSAAELGVVLASVGLASNLAALRALASEGIQKGHMRLHHRRLADCERGT